MHLHFITNLHLKKIIWQYLRNLEYPNMEYSSIMGSYS